MNSNIDNNDNYVPRHADGNNTNNLYNINYYSNSSDMSFFNTNYNTEYDNSNLFETIKVEEDTNSNINKKDGTRNKTKHKNKRRRTVKKWVWTVLLIVFLVLIFISIWKIISWIGDNRSTSKNLDKINDIADVNINEDDESTSLVNEDDDKTSDYWYYIKFPLIDVDITKLKEKNNDTVGWINVNNTNINYPYVQAKDNSYYLNHSYDKSYNEAGWVFLDYRNSKELNSKNNILYAHSRLDKTMFGSLSKTLKSNWYNNKDNHIIRLSTEDENTLWQIFSVYKIAEESYYITTDFNSDTEYLKFLNTIKDRSIHNFNTNLNANDRILTLSTCYSDTERTVVHAKLIKKSTS